MLAEIIGQETPLQVLRRAVHSGRLPQAYLFAGPANVGKTTVAVQLAKVLNCETNREFPDAQSVDCCDHCPTCLRLEGNHHPDFRIIRPLARIEGADEDAPTEITGSMITTDQVAELISDAALTISQARRKVYIITSAESMNVESANRLLKTLEEPPSATTFILTAANLSALLPTIISRCQTLQFQQVPIPEIEQFLMRRYPELDPALVHSVAALSGGRPGWAVEILQHPEVLQIRKQVLDLCVQLKEMPLVQALRLGEQLTEAAELWWLATEDPNMAEKALKASRDRILRTQMTEILNILVTWFRDLLLLSSNPEAQQIINRDRLTDLQRLAPSYQPDACRRACLHLEDLKAQLRQNANLRLANEILALRLIST